MDRNEIVAKLRAQRPRLQSLGVRTVSLFGSAARGDDTADSDVDIAVRLDEKFSNGGFDYFAKLEALRAEFSSVLGRPVDLVEEPVRTPRIQAAIDKDRIIAVQ